MNNSLTSLPPELQPFHSKIAASKLSYLHIQLEEATSVNPYQSKLGGYPYLPIGVDYPKGENGQALDFLAQINFAELPVWKASPYPKQGILQFYIGTDDLMGLDLQDLQTQKNYSTIYHKDVTAPTRQQFEVIDQLRKKEEYYSPLAQEASFLMNFELQEEYVPTGDHHFPKFLGKESFWFFDQFGDKEEQLMTAYEQRINSIKHKMSGYACFLNEDIRSYNSEMKGHLLLLQIVSQPKICWGDVGVGHFFISEQDLKARNFANVVYHWECH